jgi:hypothetical protein
MNNEEKVSWRRLSKAVIFELEFRDKAAHSADPETP